MAFSILPSSARGSRFTQLFSATALGLFLGMTYMIVEAEIRASGQPTGPSMRIDPAQPGQSDLEPAQADQSEDPTAKPVKRREGTRREWYERRKRRWVTPPEFDVDRGLPKQRRFRLS